MDSFYDAPRKTPVPVPSERVYAPPVATVPEVSLLCTVTSQANNSQTYGIQKPQINLLETRNCFQQNKENIAPRSDNTSYSNSPSSASILKRVRFESPVLQQRPSLTYEPFNSRQYNPNLQNAAEFTNQSGKSIVPGDKKLLPPFNGQTFEQIYMANVPNRHLDLSIIESPNTKPNLTSNINVDNRIQTENTANQNKSQELRTTEIPRDENIFPKSYRDYLEAQKTFDKTSLSSSSNRVTDILNYRRPSEKPSNHSELKESYNNGNAKDNYQLYPQNKISNSQKDFDKGNQPHLGQMVPDKPEYFDDRIVNPSLNLQNNNFGYPQYISKNPPSYDISDSTGLRRVFDDPQNINVPLQEHQRVSEQSLEKLSSNTVCPDIPIQTDRRKMDDIRKYHETHRNFENCIPERPLCETNSNFFEYQNSNEKYKTQNSQNKFFNEQRAKMIFPELITHGNRDQESKINPPAAVKTQETKNNSDDPSVKDLLKVISQQNEQLLLLQKQVAMLMNKSEQKQIQPPTVSQFPNEKYATSTQHEFIPNPILQGLNNTPKKKFSIDLTTSFEVSFRPQHHMFPRKHVAYEPKIQEITETESTTSEKMDKIDGKDLPNETSIVFSEPIPIRETCPSPDPSFKIQMNDYESSSDDDESSSSSSTSDIRESFYNNLMGQVNNILEKTHIQANGHEQGGRKPKSKKVMTHVKEATLRHLKSIGVDVPNADISSESSGSDGSKEYGSSEISFAVQQILMKYLPAEHLAKITYKQSGPMNTQDKPGLIPSRPEFSFASVQYMRKYNLIASTDNKHKQMLHPASAPQIAPRAVDPQRILDISTLKQQPKLL